MRPENGELFEDWCYRARMFEHGVAMQRIAQGENIDIVLEEMSKRLLSKIIHPIYDLLKNDNLSQYDAEQSKNEYKRLYLDRVSPVADHVQFDMVD